VSTMLWHENPSTMSWHSTANLEEWNGVVGIRNRIVHDYMNIDMKKILALVRDDAYRFVVEFLMDDIGL